MMSRKVLPRVLFAELPEGVLAMSSPDEKQVGGKGLPQSIARRPTGATTPTFDKTAAWIAQHGPRGWCRDGIIPCGSAVWNVPPDPGLARYHQCLIDLHDGLRRIATVTRYYSADLTLPNQTR